MNNKNLPKYLKQANVDNQSTDEDIPGQISIETLEGGKYMPDGEVCDN